MPFGGDGGGWLMVKFLLQVSPPSVENQSGAVVAVFPENPRITIWFGLLGLTAMLSSLSESVSVAFSAGFVLLTTVSRSRIFPSLPGAAGRRARLPAATSRSAGTAR